MLAARRGVVVVIALSAALWGVLHGGGASSSKPERIAASVPVTGLSWQPPGDEPYVPPTTTTTTTLPPEASAEVTRPLTGPTRSLAWWTAIAVCETGHNPPTNEWRTGYFGIEAGYSVGHLSWDEQYAWVQDIYSKYGDRAWGCAPRAWQIVPTG